MKLEDFIKATLVEIVSGIEEAKEITSSSNALVSPPVNLSNEVKYDDNFIKTEDGKAASLVTFDIAITIESSEGGSAKIGVIGSVLNLGAEGRSDTSNSQSSRLRFSIPVLLP